MEIGNAVELSNSILRAEDRDRQILEVWIAALK
jgi:hypothetical protein